MSGKVHWNRGENPLMLRLSKHGVVCFSSLQTQAYQPFGV